MLNNNMGLHNADPNFIKCVIYCRVSTDIQEEKDSLNKQIERCRAYALARDFEIVEVITDVESGSKDDRAGYLHLQELISDNVFDVLLIWELSRLSRNASGVITLVDNLIKKNIQIVSIRESFDTSTVMGKAMLQLNAVLAELERNTISGRVKDRMQQLLKEGRFLGQAPFGYRFNDKKLLIVVDEEAVIIKDIFQRFLHGENKESIARVYNTYPTKIARWLAYPIYNGKIAYVGSGKNRLRTSYHAIYDGLHEAIIDDETFWAVQGLLAKTRPNRVFNNPLFIFSGVLYCGTCGDKMYVSQKRGENTIYYGCNSIRKGHSCGQKFKRSDELEREILKLLRDRISKEDIEYKKDDSISREIQLLEKNIKALNSKLEKAKELFYNNIIDIKTLGEDSKKIKSEIEVYEKKLEKIKSKNEVEIDQKKIKEIVIKKIDELENDPGKFKKIVRIAINKIVVNKDLSIDVTFNF